MNIKLSPKHGLNPTLLACPICFKETGVGLVGRLPGDAQAPRRSRDRQPCAECTEHMAMGVLLVEATRQGNDESTTATTGRRWVITPEAAQRMLLLLDPGQRVAYIEPEAAQKLGLYKPE